MYVRTACLAALGLLAGVAIQEAFAFPVGGDQTVLPAGTELNEDAINLPREVFKSEALDGRKSYLVNLGDLAFSAPTILGGVARQAGISCSTCHVNGASNPKLFVPGMSAHPGTFDTTGPLFNPKADNLTFDPVRIPSLRGARYLAPYGHDGRMASLRDAISHRSRAQVDVIDPLRAASLDSKSIGALDLEQHGPAAAVAFGLALRKDRERAA